MDENKLTRRNTISNIKTNPGKKNKPKIDTRTRRQILSQKSKGENPKKIKKGGKA